MALLLVAACTQDTPRQPPVAVREAAPLATGKAQRRRLCGRGRDDLVIEAFCGRSPPKIRSFADLREALGLGTNENLIHQGFALTGHSTSLVARVVSAVNPRMVFVRVENDTHELTGLAFTRGESFSEIVVRDRDDQQLRFYVGAFSLECEESREGCTPADRFTLDFESGWSDFNLYAEEDVENTPMDCRVCHQPDGPGTPRILRMQEFQAPWTHWLYRLSEGGRALLADYNAAKGDEPFAGVPADELQLSQPGLLNSTIFFAGMPTQPNEFPSEAIELEVIESAAKRGGAQPVDNSVPGQSATWRKLYERARRGDAISVPYHDVKVTDPGKLAEATEAYVDYRAGRLPRELLPDLGEVFPDDPELRARMGLVTEPGLSGKQVLQQACAQCHNDRLDQTISRARFSVDLSRMGREEKRRAIARVSLPTDDPAVMPPALFRRLSDEGRTRLIELLER
ncbi:MAG: hypothetical protein OXU20_37050 [Myxococcales bacterium]|nr:hypothetical protein [Myxococcales bacterium]